MRSGFDSDQVIVRERRCVDPSQWENRGDLHRCRAGGKPLTNIIITAAGDNDGDRTS
jgi:hypothetical protein